MEGHLFGQTCFVHLQEVLDLSHALLFFLELSLQVVSSGELVVDVVSHGSDLVFSLLHFLLDTAFQVLDFFEIVLDGFLLDPESDSSGLTIL